MSNTKKTAKNEQEVDVLYQKLGERWFAFSIVDDEVFMTPVSDDQINEIRESVTANSFRDYNGGANEAA